MNDLISRKALLNDFRKTITEQSGTMDWLNMINRQPSVGDNRWIPVSERLPEENGYYLVSCKGGDIHIDFWWKDKKSDKIFNDKWENKYEYIIIAWMPLPESYKE